MTRKAVYKIIDGERAYQDAKWKDDLGQPEHHSLGDWLVFMEVYLRRAQLQLTTRHDSEATQLTLDSIRKITALGVACMEQQLDVPARKLP